MSGFGAAIAGDLISSGLNFIANERSNKSNESMNWQNIKYQQDENRYQRNWQNEQNRLAEQWQEKMWNAQNEYNSPLNQRKRLQEAGYNPWISGSGGGSFNSAAGSAGSGHSQGASMMQVGSQIPNHAFQLDPHMFSNIALAQANISNQNADTLIKASRASTEYLKATGDYKGAQSILKHALASGQFNEKQLGDISKGINQEYLSWKIDNDKKATEAHLIEIYGPQKAQKEMSLLDKTISEVDAKIDVLKSDKNLNEQKVKTLAEEAAKLIEEKLTIKETRDVIKRKLEAEAKILENDPMQSEWFSSMMKGSGVVANLTKFVALILKALK